MKNMLMLASLLVCSLVLTSCGGKKEEPKVESATVTEVVVQEATPEATAPVATKEVQ